MWWFRVGAAALWLLACEERTTTHYPAQTTDPDPSEVMCVDGASCPCQGNTEGKVVCDPGRHCDCPACDPLPPKDAPTVMGCGGVPIGTWRLAEAQWGTANLYVAVAGEDRGTCDLTYTPLASELPRMLMRLHEGGDADVFSESMKMRLAYEESCATSKSSVVTCGSKSLDSVSSCSLDCNVCSCDATIQGIDLSKGSWSRTEALLSVPLFDSAPEFAYCLKGDRLELSARGMYFVFERVTELSRPAACDDRVPDDCAVGKGSTCELGSLCAGGQKCLAASSQGECGTIAGCTWHDRACGGFNQGTCALPEFGVVKGCELTTKPVTCEGAPEPCNGRDWSQCVGGCSMNQKGRCTGTLACEKFLFCPISGCAPQSDFVKCKPGEFSCGDYATLESVCDDVAKTYDGEGCQWESFFCEGKPQPCADVSVDECNHVPGCQLVEH